ncbi:hypothetical protein LTR60_004702, partial [Cryomyces antarcticus]
MFKLFSSMKAFSVIVLLHPLLSPSSASPLVKRSWNMILTPADIQLVAPSTATCASAAFPDECRTADQAADYIWESFKTYGITTFHEQAALLSLMLFESGEFKYNKNHWPGVPGQGTRNMQSPVFNLLYAESVPALALTLSQVEGEGPAYILGLISPDRYSFASAAWFLANQCSISVRQGLQAGTLQGWETYLTSCVGTTATDDRTAYWTKAMKLGA